MVEKFLCDTNVISEVLKPRPNKGVQDWLRRTDPDRLFISVITLGEIRKGIVERAQKHSSKKGSDQKQVALENWLLDLVGAYQDRILSVDSVVANTWGEMLAESPHHVVDALLAATAKTYDLTLVTRNTKDIRHREVPVLDPFS